MILKGMKLKGTNPPVEHQHPLKNSAEAKNQDMYVENSPLLRDATTISNLNYARVAILKSSKEYSFPQWGVKNRII